MTDVSKMTDDELFARLKAKEPTAAQSSMLEFVGKKAEPSHMGELLSVLAACVVLLVIWWDYKRVQRMKMPPPPKPKPLEQVRDTQPMNYGDHEDVWSSSPSPESNLTAYDWAQIHERIAAVKVESARTSSAAICCMGVLVLSTSATVEWAWMVAVPFAYWGYRKLVKPAEIEHAKALQNLRRRA